MLIDDMPLNIT